MYDVSTVYTLDKDSLKELVNYYIASAESREVLGEILEKLQVGSFIVEDDYVDKDYLVDYTNFFSRCHIQYSRFCKRIHFFSSDAILSNEQFSENLVTLSEEFSTNLNSNYLGFIVLKEYKERWLMGRTCLKYYPEKSERYYTAVRDYHVNLYGIPLTVSSMAFQEQDEATGVCASVAVYSALNVTGVKFQHEIPSLSEVTQLCLTDSSYMKVKDGLSKNHIAYGISKIGLHPEVFMPNNDREIRSILYAYLKSGIPIICGLWLFDSASKSVIDSGLVNYHAVTINGFSFEEGAQKSPYRDEVVLFSDRMSRFYVHDDQLGPFVRMSFTNDFQNVDGLFFKKITTSWRCESLNSNENKFARIQYLIVPLPLKARVSYFDIENEVNTFNTKFRRHISSLSGNFNSNIEWDIYLITVNDLKHDLLTKEIIDKEQVLKSSFAKYLWRGVALVDDKRVFELIFDGTDSAKSGIPRREIFYTKEYQKLYNWYIKQPTNNE